MRTREIFRYLVAMIIALSTTVNAMAQERNLKIYFNEYVEGATGAPIMLVTDDNNSYGLPAGLTYSSEGMAWAKEARFFEWVNQDVKDRLIADYVTKNGTVDKKNSHLMISFENFPYEVNGIQWNVMNDLLSGSITEFFKNYNVTTKCTPVSGSGFSYTEEHWAMNIFQHSTSFNKGSIPWQNGAILKGLKSFELSEKYFVELGLGNWTLWNFGQSELSAKCRTFFKAGWNGQEGSNSNITDSDDNNWAFKITFTMPEIRVRNGRDLFEGDVNQIEGYISAHQGAVEVTSNPSDIDKFHFEYFSSNDNVATIIQHTGVIRAKNAGDVDITVKLMRGNRDVCSYNYPLTVLEKANNPNNSPTAEICLVFNNGNKGYDLTVGDTNGKIQGNIVSVFGGSINVTNNTNGYHYEYTSANTDIATIDQYGNITPKKEGDVDISAVLKYGNTVVSNTYTYTLHVFAPNEGLDWSREKTYSYNYTNADNKYLWVIKNYQSTPNASHDWIPTTLLKTDTYIRQNASGSDNNSWKQIAGFTTPNVDYWRAICQKVKLDVKVPKYSKATATYKFAGNVTLKEDVKSTNYGFEIKDLGVVSSDEADNEMLSISLDTYSENAGVVSNPTTLPTLVRKATKIGYNSFMGASSNAPMWEVDNRGGESATSETRYLAAMVYLLRTHPYGSHTNAAEATIGYKDIPTYTYYSHIYYSKNYGDYVGDFYKDEELYSEGKTGTMKMNKFSAPTRKGYTFLGWSTNPEATVAEYEYQGEFCSYDDVNGGGKGPVYLYAVWRPIPYTVTLNHNYSPYETEEIFAYYGQPMPEDESIVAPTRTGYDFTGYRTQKDITPQVFYYNAEMKSVCNYDKTSDYTIFANWEAHTTTVVFDPQGGNNYGATRVTATFSAAMPTEGVQAPQRQGYTFGGYYSKPNGAGTQYYTASMTSARTWNIDERLLDPQVTEITLYAKWTKVVFTVTLDADGGTIDGSVETWPMTSILENNGGSLVLQVHAGESECSEIWGSTRINIKPGYKLLGWYTEPQTESDVNHHPALHPGTLVYSVEPSNNLSYHFSAVPETGSNPKYWNSGTKWVGTDDLTLYAHYEIIFEVEDDVITFTDMTPKNYVLGEDLTAALDYAKEHHVAMVNTIDMRYPDTGESGKNGESIMKAFEDAKEETNSIVSPNALILFTSTWPSQRTTNAVTLNENGGECQNLVVTDRYSMRIPVNFKADKASYARDAQVNDAATEQASKSTWGTLCLPYPIKNNTNGVKFYWLQSTANNYMEFEEFGDNAIIPANTPVLYSRTDGDVSSKINIVEANVNVPENADYTPVIIDYANPKKGTYPLESASATLQDWEFRGNLKTNIFYGAKYVGKIEENAQRVDNGDVYYFKQNKFTHLTPAMTKMVNGKEVHYEAGKMTIFPYRAYFYKKGVNGSPAKVSAYSILVVDEFGNTTDITNTVFGDGEGDGKIYDLNGIRVMQPVKGRLYIVNGQKKVYR